MLRQIDIPPLWLGVSLVLAWALSFLLAVPFVTAGLVLIGLGAGLMAVAVLQMVLARTTFIPRRNPAALVSGGAFAISRNPIYLGDALILTGGDSVLGRIVCATTGAGLHVVDNAAIYPG